MISLNDTIAADLWRAHVAYAGSARSEYQHRSLPSVACPATPPRFSLSSDDEDHDTSELPYLCVEFADERPDSPAPSLFSDSACSSESGHSSFTSVCSEGSSRRSSFCADVAIGSGRHETTFACPTPKVLHPSRPALAISLGSHTVGLNLPSPADSGYGSCPITPLSEEDRLPAAEDATWSPVDDSCSLSEESMVSHIQPECSPDVKQDGPVVDAKASLQPDSQGPVTPRIVLFDEEGRVVDTDFDEPATSRSVFGCPPVDEADSPYGGFVSTVQHRITEPVIPRFHVSASTKLKSSATGSVLDRAFAPYTPRSQIAPSTTPIYHNRHRAPTFALDCLGEKEEEVLEEAVSTFWILEEEGVEVEECEECITDVVCVESAVNVPSICQAPGEPVEHSLDTSAACAGYRSSSAPQLSTPVSSSTDGHRFSISDPDDDEEQDDECESCGLFFTAPDDHYSRLMETLDRPQVQPAIVFGLLKTLGRPTTKRELNTNYHLSEQGRGLGLTAVDCALDCERGFWAESQGLASIEVPSWCLAHGGRGSCAIGAIFHCPVVAPVVSPSAGSVFDYASHAAEIVGILPSTAAHLEDEELDDDDLVLHSSARIHPMSRKDEAPKAGAGYDDYMSRFMDDVDLTPSGSVDISKGAPFGKLGGALKELRGATVPEAVDHLKEGLEKTESVFRTAFATHFRLNSMTDKFVRGHKSQLSREKLPVSESRHSRKESSTSSMKTKWSNMLNKFTR